MNTSPRQLEPADRAELCRRVDFLAVLAGDGVEAQRNGRAYLCKLRPERTPSCHVYPPGVGRKGAAGWTLHDYGDGWDGDALAYLVDRRGLDYLDAVAELCNLTAWTPPGWENDRPGRPRTAGNAPTHTLTPPAPPAPPVAPLMDTEAQTDAAAAFLAGLLDLVPDAAAQGAAYLAGRGCLPAGGAVGVFMLPADVCRPLAAKLADGPDADAMTRAGLLKPAQDGKPIRLPWWDAVCLLACHTADGWPAYLVGRRMDWKAGNRWGKYINQPCAGGAVRLPFGLPMLYQAAARLDGWPWTPAKDKAGDVLLVEGALDALGAACLGWPAVALLTRLQTHNPTDRDGAAARALEAHLPALRAVRRVLIVPDADPGPKGADGEALAARLVGWLHYAGVKADLARVPELCPDATPDCKDLADVAAMKKDTMP